MAPSEERIGEIESLFRNVNERIAAAADRFDVESAEFYCECHDPACAASASSTRSRSTRPVREKGKQLLHAPGHVERRFERIVARRSRSAIVEKFGRTLARVARRLDPRAEPASGA
jgi:hypothetical protein